MSDQETAANEKEDKDSQETAANEKEDKDSQATDLDSLSDLQELEKIKKDLL